MRDHILFGFLFAMLIGTCFAQNATTSDVNAFKLALEKDGFTVQEGRIGYFDTIKAYNLGVLTSALGNNPTTK